RRGRLRVDRRFPDLFDLLDRALFALLLLQEQEELRPTVDEVRSDRERAIEVLALAGLVLLAAGDLRELDGGHRVVLQEVLRALERALGLLPFLLRGLAHAEEKPEVATAALRDDLREDRFGLRPLLVLHELLRVDLAAIEVVLVPVPALVETGEQIF